jgi:hypothetical protein
MDSFADANGHSISQTDGKIEIAGPPATRRVLPFMGVSQQAQGKLSIVALEDSVTRGFDQQPGVLAISFKTVPTAASYCGFAYLGGVTPEKALQLNEITKAPSVETLKNIKLTFRFKAANSVDAAAVGARYGCRLEPLVENSYASRLAFGVIEATDQWQTFETMLDRGENLENFVKAVAASPPAAFKIILSQQGPITNYQAGDTLLVDDIEFSRISP